LSAAVDVAFDFAHTNKSNVKGSGQECPLYTSDGHGAEVASVLLYSWPVKAWCSSSDRYGVDFWAEPT
jgi:hypothetical protein